MTQQAAKPWTGIDAVCGVLLAVCAWNIYSFPSNRPTVTAYRLAIITFAGIGLAAGRLTPGGRIDSNESDDADDDEPIPAFDCLHEYRQALPAEFPGLDLAFYDAHRAWLEEQGFVFIGDRENVTLTRHFPHLRTFIRACVGDGGATLAGVYHVRPGGWMKPIAEAGAVPDEMKVLEFETELNNGTFITTGNTLDASTAGSNVPGITAHRYPKATPPGELLGAHRAAVRAALASSPALKATHCHTADEVIAFQHRMQAMKSAHRQLLGAGNDWESALPVAKTKTSAAPIRAEANTQQIDEDSAEHDPSPLDRVPKRSAA